MSRKKNQSSNSNSSHRAGGDQPALSDELINSDGERELLQFEGGASRASIKVIGVGGGGGNAVKTMVGSGLTGVQFIAANTDSQALQHNSAPMKLQLGDKETRGLGCGADPDKGRASATEVRDRIRELLDDTDMVFVTAGLGGGTGTGAAPIVAEVARELGALTVGVVTKPFLFEGRMRMKHAERGLDELHRVVDTVITIPNQRLLALAGKGTSVRDSFKLADEVLFNAVRGISDLITIHGLINLDFADVRTIMNEMGVALMGTGTASGDERAVESARAAISSPLLEDLSIEGAHGVLINITGGEDLSLFEVNEASTLIQEAAHEDANIIFGAVIDEQMPAGEMRVTVIATGLDDARVRRSPDLGYPVDSHGNVTPLRPESSGGSSHVETLTPAASIDSQPVQAEFREVSPSQTPLHQEPEGEHGADWVSPFDDELDIPTFLRRSAD
ncbi:MAG: cell division protein FtsZ [Deltaproteobacteria bacterium]|jgi:cell division protein FtsZ|nr:cell division protein FtsZ [Deltaproteobacteria bacterium]